MAQPARKMPIGASMRDWAKLRTELMWAYEGVIHPRYLSLPRDIEPGIPIYYLKRGQLTIASESEERVATEGQWAFITKKLQRRDFSPDAEIISVRFILSRPDGRSFFDHNEMMIFAHEDFPELLERSRKLLGCIREGAPETVRTNLWHQSSDIDGYLLIRETFFGWLRCLIETFRKQDNAINPFDGLDERIRSAIQFLDLLPIDRELREADLAQRIGLSVSQINRLFVRELGQTPKQYWDNRRLDAAIVQLSSSMTPIKQIAVELGFGSQNYFARWFRARSQMSPSDYREKYAQSW
ncbi:helix-turn-helix domain-containing protein [Cerasicoccus fimbriatus]|uniref:helix-turn-helix domain-containing protein n=1 Tax=Cerasicoccus fimbriatus TaxID=3014554 RepID=UPI0022B45F51|nr:AraC family transcriptional regulator [Cerasicoccus sp. TK19100]